MRTKDTRSATQAISDAYYEALVGIFSLRLPDVKEIVLRTAPTVVLKSSYPGQDILLDTNGILADLSTQGDQIRHSVTQLNRIFVAAMWDTLTVHENYEAIATKPEIQFFPDFLQGRRPTPAIRRHWLHLLRRCTGARLCAV